ncbi:MAG: hypothetical protein MHM6MM_001618 [Cercozoa sp. M6MM]
MSQAPPENELKKVNERARHVLDAFVFSDLESNRWILAPAKASVEGRASFEAKRQAALKQFQEGEIQAAATAATTAAAAAPVASRFAPQQQHWQQPQHQQHPPQYHQPHMYQQAQQQHQLQHQQHYGFRYGQQQNLR